MNRIDLSAVALVLVQVSIAQAQSLSPQDIHGLLGKIRERRSAAPYVQADFREEKSIHLMNRPITSTGKVWFEPPNRFRREVRGTSPSVTVCDGRELWIYYPNFKSAERYPLGKGSPLDSTVAAINSALNLENIENTFQITPTKSDNGYELALLPRTASMKRVFQKLDLHFNDNLRVDRTDMLLPNGDRIVTAYTNQTRAAVPASTFEFTPPAGTEISTPLGQ